jgi:F0F1-type ATP synthase assembly protein I
LADDENQDHGPEDPGWVQAARYAGFGFEFAGIVVAGVLLGDYLDRHLGTSPWLTLLLTVGAMAGAVRRLLWSLKKNSSR